LNPLPLSMQSKQSTCMFTPAHSDHTIDTRKDDLKLEMQSCIHVQQILAQKYGKEMFIPGSLHSCVLDQVTDFLHILV